MKRVSCLILAVLLFASLCPAMQASAAAEENAWFPAYTMEINQLAYESYSHGSQNGIDMIPHGNVFAPFTGTITKVDPRWGYVELQSNSKVHWADGTYDYMTVAFMHDSDVSDLYVGKVIKQGEDFYQAGGMGNGNPSEYGIHVHLAVYRGKNGAGLYYGNGNVFAYDAFFVNPEMTTNYAGKGEGVVERGNSVYNNAPTSYAGLWVTENPYLAKCSSHPAHANLTVKKATYIKTLPCSRKTCEDSDDIRKAKVGETFIATKLYQNTAGNYWYQIQVGDQTGYVFAGDVSTDSFLCDVEIKKVSAPTSINQGNVFSIKGDISSEYCVISTVYGAITKGGANFVYHYGDNINGTSYSLYNSKVDMAMLFNELPTGSYYYEVDATVIFYYSNDGKTLSETEYCSNLVFQEFTVK